LLGGNVLPDLRGEFLRGWDDGRGVDSGRGLLATQSGQNEAHSHGAGSLQVPLRVTGNNGVNKARGYQTNDAANNYHNVIGTTASSGGTETRPRNIAVLYIIKASA
ncbi:MAG: hypothetical protein JKY49_18275, partial [Cohaesibacteraceae bacterium]|nr:hypothetical protein [Cohaesibacteraceae bacterium]